jgi:hypothetical protein
MVCFMPIRVKTGMIRENPYTLLCLAFIIIFSIAAGVSTYFTVYSGSQGFFPGDYSGTSFRFIFFFKSLLLNVSFYILICLSGIWIPGLLLSLLSLILKGFIDGFVAGAILSEMGFAGVPVLIFAVILPETVILAILTAASVRSFGEWRLRIRDFSNGRRCIPVSKTYIKEAALFFLLIFLTVLLQSIVSALTFRFSA